MDRPGVARFGEVWYWFGSGVFLSGPVSLGTVRDSRVQNEPYFYNFSFRTPAIKRKKMTNAELERLALLVEECAEVQQIAMKIMRHGYDSFHPEDPDMTPNRQLLEKELGDLRFAHQLMFQNNDVSFGEMNKHADRKREKIQKYLHHNAV